MVSGYLVFGLSDSVIELNIVNIEMNMAKNTWGIEINLFLLILVKKFKCVGSYKN